MIQAGIIGGAGYTAGELIRLLIIHPDAELAFAYSASHAGQPLCHVHQDLVGDTDMEFTSSYQNDVDVLFLCSGHGKSEKFMSETELPKSLKIIDLSADFRMSDDFVYGLPELNRRKYHSRIANPGCFATAIQLALLPLADKQLLQHEIHVHALTGSTGAGQSLSSITHFSWRFGNVSVYKPFQHQHLAEIENSLGKMQGIPVKMNFIPVRGPFTRGIFASVYTQCSLSEPELQQLYDEYFRDEPFTIVSDTPVDLKQVVNTNKCVLHVEKQGEYAFITAVIDNLLKGASGQAVQNMNILFGLHQTTGLKLKSTYF